MTDRPFTWATLDWPPVWTAAAVVLSWLAAQIMPWPLFGTLGQVLGAVLALAGLGLMAAAALEMQKARTTVIPRRPPTALVTSGIFEYSRNPIYLGDLLVTAGAMLWFQVPLGAADGRRPGLGPAHKVHRRRGAAPDRSLRCRIRPLGLAHGPLDRPQGGIGRRRSAIGC